MMLGKDRIAELRAIGKLNKLATGSQTVPNSVAELAAAQDKSPLVGPPTTAAPPAPQRKKLSLKKAKRKAPRVVSDEEMDESTEDGLVCKRKRRVVVEPPAVENATPNFIEHPPNASTPFESAGDVLVSNASVAEAAPEQLADTQISSQVAEKLLTSPPRLETSLAIQTCEGGGEHQPPPPPSTPGLPTSLQEALKNFNARQRAMADENLPHIVAEGLKDHLEKVELDCRIYKEAANTAKVETDKVKCDMLLQGIEFSRVENALKDELKSVRDDKNELRRKLHDKVQETIDLESKLVPLRKQVAELVEARKADEAQVSKLEKKSTEREVLLGKVEQDRDKAIKELGETAAELARAREENNELKAKVEKL